MKQMLDPIELALATDPVFQRRQTATAGALMNIGLGAGPIEHYKELEEQAYYAAQLGLGKGKLSQTATLGMGEFKELNAGTFWGSAAIQHTKETMKEMLTAKGAAVGLPAFDFGATSFTAKQRAQDVFEYEKLLSEKGIAPGFNLDPMLAKMDEQLTEGRKLREAYERSMKGPMAEPEPAGARR
jgi:hypothetical protein